MPQSISIAVLVLGGVLLLVAITGGKFKIFEAEIDSAVSSKLVRLISGAIGLILITVALTLGSPVSKPDSNKTDAANPQPSQAPTAQTHADQPASVQADPTPAQPAPASNTTSPMGAAIVFDPPSNVREAANASSNILCSVTQKTTIHILREEGNWYVTDVCGKPGYINRTQVKF